LTPNVEPKATEHIVDIVEAVDKLIQQGFAYEKDGDVYYRVREFKEYGKLSGRNIDDLISGSRIAVGDKKEDPLDFALWKASKDDEPSWDSPWGQGRPGWHIECSVMSQKYLGDTFDIHGGGHDLIFPHHENEIAQSEALTGKTFANYWVHNGFVTINKEKMSKSTGNFFALEDIYKLYEPRILRYFLLSRHYKVPLDYSTDLLDESKTAWHRLENSIGLIESHLAKNNIRSNNIYEDAYKKFSSAMNDDFNTTQATAVLLTTVKELYVECMNGSVEKVLAEKYNAVKKICDILGLTIQSPNNVSLGDSEQVMDDDQMETILAKNSMDESDVRKLLLWRLCLRNNKNYAKADEVRDVLTKSGFSLSDKKDETIFFKI